MCGIAGEICPRGGISRPAGFYGPILSSMARRGPDQEGLFQGECCALLHRRLSVIDPSGGIQPMTAGPYTMVYNGELYNTAELREELSSLGVSFSSHSDTEVLLQAFLRWGHRMPEKLNGIFAFAVYDERNRSLFFARDPMGVKPLFYAVRGGTLFFASELKTLLLFPEIAPEVDARGLYDLLFLGPGRTPGCGIFRNVHEVLPGQQGLFDEDGLAMTLYWKLEDRPFSDSFDLCAEKTRFLVEDSIRRQVVSDVPIGTFLSGGLDSSIITAVCTRELAGRGERLKTFSVDYENNDKFFRANKFQPNSDASFIDLMQKDLATEHHATVLTPEDLVAALEEATIARDLPGMADVDFSLLAFCKDIRREVKVALSGECADEIFGGYPWYRDPEVRAKAGFPWAQNTVQRAALLAQVPERNAEDFVMDAYTETCRASDILPETPAEERRVKEMVNLNFRWFMQTLLDRKDRMSMYHALEVRVPFCDYRIAEYLYGVPWEFKDHQGREKGLLRYAMEGLLPPEVLYRKKSPYPKTFDPRYEAMVNQRLQNLLQQDAPLWQLVKKQEVVKLLEGEAIWPWYGQLMRRPQTIAYLLQIDFWLRYYHVEICF